MTTSTRGGSTRTSPSRTSATRSTRPRSTVVPAADKIAARARAERSLRRHRLARRIALMLLTLGAAGGIGWVVLASGWLDVDKVSVSGTSRLSVEEVTAAAAVPVGQPLALVDTGEVAARVRQLAPVASVDVRRSLPGTVRVAVTERTPVALHAGRGGLRLVDGTGLPFITVPEPPPGLVRLQVARPAPDDPSTVAALAVATELPADLRAQVATVAADSPAAVTLRLHDGREVVWGRPGDAATKAAAVKALLAMPGQTVDVSAPGVAVRR